MKLVKNDKVKEFHVKDFVKNITKKEKAKNGENYISLENIEGGNIEKLKEKLTTSEIKSDLIKFEKSDIIYGKCRPNLDKCIIANEKGYTTGESLVYRTNLFSFFVFLFHTKKFIEYNISLSTGAKMPRTSNKNVINYKFYQKDENEMTKNGQFLYNSYDNIKNIKSLIEKLEIRNEEMAERLLSGELRVRLDSNGEMEFYKNPDDNWEEVKLNGKSKNIPSDWDVDLLKNIIDLKKGISISSSELNHDGNGIQYLRTNEIWDTSSKTKDPVFYNGDLKKIETKDLNDWVICFDGYNRNPSEGTLGMVTNAGQGILSGELFKIKSKKAVSELYVNINILRSFYFQELICRYGEGSTVKHAGKHVKNISIHKIPIFEQKLLNKIFEPQIKEINKLKQLLKYEKIRFEQMSEMLLSGEYVLED